MPDRAPSPHETDHDAFWHTPCEHPDCELVICQDRACTPHGEYVEPGCTHGLNYCLEHLWECDWCCGEARTERVL